MHVLQPKHIKIKGDEALKLLSKYNISKEQLPKIRKSDPAIVDLNAHVGEIIKIIRKSEEDEEEYYRIVI